jgi:hypothetical protein
VNHSFGELSVEGWDRPEVELTVTKSPDELYGPKDQAEAAKFVENVHITAERRSDTDLEISTSVDPFQALDASLRSHGRRHAGVPDSRTAQHEAGDSP